MFENVETKKVSANFNIDTSSDLYTNLIQPKVASRKLSDFVYDILDVYNSNPAIRELIDIELDKRDPLNALKDQVSRVMLEHEKTVLTSRILTGFIEFNSENVINPSEDTSINIEEVFTKDGVIENMKALLPTSVQEKIDDNILERVKKLEELMRTVISNMEKSGIVTTNNNNNDSVKVSNIVDKLEGTIGNPVLEKINGVIEETVDMSSINSTTKVDTVSMVQPNTQPNTYINNVETDIIPKEVVREVAIEEVKETPTEEPKKRGNSKFQRMKQSVSSAVGK